MKVRIIGTLLVLIVLGVLFVLTDSSPTTATQNRPAQQEDLNLKGLTIN